LKQRVIGEAISDGALINALRVEPDLGTPARGGLPATVARRTPEGWRISGRKIYSTGSTALTWFVVWARSDDPEPLVGGWLVRADTPGVVIEETWDHLGLRASASHDVIFEDVLVPLDHALDPQPVGAPPPYPATFAAWSAVLTAAIYDAVARAARDWLIDFLASRKPANLGAALSTLPSFRSAISTACCCPTACCSTRPRAARSAGSRPGWSSTWSPRTPSAWSRRP
jgi:alkylation response protein AidB-like acyl-CoA dehydrogenase